LTLSTTVERWKGISCALATTPCTSSSHGTVKTVCKICASLRTSY
jgi:hypothetical protein